MTDSLQKVRQDSGSPGTVCGMTINAFPNEITDIQVHMQAPAGGIPSFKVDLGSITNSQTGTVISSTTFDIITYRESYMNVSTKTCTQATCYNATGLYPDALIPTIDPYWKQTTNAFPFSVKASSNQSAWIDIHIPTSAPSGYYFGTIVVSSASTVLANLPLVVGVWQWPSGMATPYMPSTATLRTIIPTGYAALCIPQYGGPTNKGCAAYTNAAFDDDGAGLTMLDALTFGLDHRVTIFIPYPPISSGFGAFETRWEPVLKGTQTRTPQILPGARPTTTQSQFGSYNVTSASNWTTEASNRGWNYNSSMPFDYTCDEPPNGCSYSQFIASATTMHSASPQMATLITSELNLLNLNGAQSSVDIITPIMNALDPIGGTLQRPIYDVWKATHTGPTAQIFTYIDCVQTGTCSNGTTGTDQSKTWPNRDIDGLPVANRATEWLESYRLKTDGELYFTSTYCLTQAPGACGLAGSTDSWKSVYYSGGWGDGTIMYPGTTAQVAVSTPIWIPSMRLKYMRDGVQDFEYLNAANTNGLSATATAQSQVWITSSTMFNIDPANNGIYTGTINSARTALGNAIHALSFPAAAVPRATGTVYFMRNQ